MISFVLDIFKNLTGIIKNLNLTKEQAIIVICVIAVIGSLWSASHYKGEVNRLEIDLHSAQKELFIERNNVVIDVNNKEMKQLQTELHDTNRRFVALYKQYNDLLGSDKSYTEIMEGLGELNNTQDICDAWIRRGFYICDE